MSALGLWLRSAAVWVEMTGATVGDLLRSLADRADPPPLDYAGFDTRLCGLDPADTDGYFAETGGRS